MSEGSKDGPSRSAVDPSLAQIGDRRYREDDDDQDDPEDILEFQPLGAGREVGRSCHILRFKGKTVMLDCGVHPGFQGRKAFPYIDSIDAREVDLVLITHFHLDHVGGLAHFMSERQMFNEGKGRVFMTPPTKFIMNWVLRDMIRNASSNDSDAASNSAQGPQFNQADLDNCLRKVEEIDFHATKDVGGIKFTPLYAGHVLGACQYLIEIAGVKILYTGDYSREEDRILPIAEVPSSKPDIMITESTFGIQNMSPHHERETRFKEIVDETINRAGKCLIPIFSVGRAQELLLILDEYWTNHAEELRMIPIYYMSQLAKRCMSAFETFTGAMNESIGRQMRERNPFQFRHIKSVKSVRDPEFDRSGPCVVLASPGMLQSGNSRELFEDWCGDRRNTCLIAGYAVKNTLAHDVKDEPDEVKSSDGRMLKRKIRVKSVSFAAHVDYKENSDFIKRVGAKEVVLVHGEEQQMQRFKTQFERETREEGSYTPSLYQPNNTDTIKFKFRGDKMGKVIGKVASEPPRNGQKISGLLFKRSFNYFIVSPEELAQHTNNELKPSVVLQKQLIVYTHGLPLLRHHLLLIHGHKSVRFEPADAGVGLKYVPGSDAAAAEAAAEAPNTEIVVMEKIKLTHDATDETILLEWNADAENDMWADSILATILQVGSSPATLKLAEQCCAADVDVAEATNEAIGLQLCEHLADVFGDCGISRDGRALEVSVDGNVASVDLRNFEVECAQTYLAKSVRQATKWFVHSLEPPTAAAAEPTECAEAALPSGGGAAAAAAAAATFKDTEGTSGERVVQPLIAAFEDTAST